MPTSFETFINDELPLRVSTLDAPVSGDLPVFTGLGLITEAKTPSDLGLATTSYVDTAVTKVWKDQGDYNVSGGTAWPTSANTIGTVPIKAGFLWVVAGAAVDGTTLIGGKVVSNGDTIRALVDAATNAGADWGVNEANLGYTPENQNNKDTDGTLAANSDTKYPSQKAVKTYADTKQAALVSGTNIKTVNGSSLLGSGDLITATIPEVKSASFTAVTGKAYTLGSPGSTLNIQFPIGTTNGEEIIIHVNRSAQTQAVYTVPPAGQHVVYVGAGSYHLYSGFCDHILRFEFVLSTQLWELKGIVPAGSITDVMAFCSSTNVLARLKFNLPTADGAYQWYTPAKDINFGHLSSVATTNSNVLGGTDCRIEGGTNNDVSGTMSSTYNCKYHTVVGTYNKAMLSIPTSGTGIFTHAGNGNTYFGHTHTGNTTAVATTNCTFYNCFQSVGHSSDVNVVYRSAGSGSGSGFLGFMPHTQVTGNGVSTLPLKALCMLKSAAVATGVSTTLVSPVSGAVIDKPPLIRFGGNGAVHDIVFNCYDTNLFASPRYMLCLRRQVTVFYDSSTPVIAQATIGTDLNPAGLTYSIAISLSGTNRMLITVTATDPVSPAPPFPLTYEWSAIVESSYF